MTLDCSTDAWTAVKFSKPQALKAPIHVSEMACCSCVCFAGEQKKKELEEAAAKKKKEVEAAAKVGSWVSRFIFRLAAENERD